jgi:hypothetical protein
VDFDPSQVSYEELVELFFSFHDATRAPTSGQYRSVIFAGDAEQEQIAQSVLQRVQEGSERTIRTQIVALGGFTLAEDYHQKYALQSDGLIFAELHAIYPDIWELVDSTAAMRLNSYIYGDGTPEQLQAELDGLGLSPAAQEYLVSASPVGACPVN